MKAIIVRLIVCLLPIFVHAEIPYILFTVPKSGTHLAKNLFEVLTKKEGRFMYLPGHDFDKVYPEHFSNGIFYFFHYRDWSFLPKQKRLFHDMTIFVNVRDPRDVCLSSTFFFGKELKTLLGPDATFDEKLLYVIQCNNLHDGLHDFFGPLVMYQKVFEIIDFYQPIVIRYEDLIGPLGGGDAENQVRVIRKIAGKLAIPLTNAQAALVGEKIYGNSLTFREGHTGSWRSHFKDVHKKAFKESALEEILLKLNYETNHDW